MSNPVFIITDVGNAAVNATILGGMAVNISSFRVGTDYLIPATPLDTSLKGSLLYSGVPTSYGYLDANTVAVRLEIPVEVGPFEFGEIGLFTDSGVMFARASFGSPQQKYSAALTGLPNIWRITALLRFSQAPSLFNIQTTSQNRILEAANFGLISSPATMIGSPNAVIVRETTPSGDSVLMWASSPSRWAIAKYTRLGYITLDVDSTPNDLFSSDWNLHSSSAVPGEYLIQTLSGDVRSIASVGSGSAVLTQTLSPLPAGSVLDLYKADSGSVNTTFVPSSVYNGLVSVFNTVWSSVSGTNETNGRGWLQNPIPTTAAGVDPTPAEWAAFTSAVHSANQLLGLPNAIPFTGLGSDWQSNYMDNLMAYTSLVNSVNAAASMPPGRVAPTALERMNNPAMMASGPWSSLTYAVDAEFLTADLMASFFNSGGYVGFDVSVVPDNYVQRVLQIELEQLGVISASAGSSESRGSRRISFNSGDGVITNAGNAGFYGLTGTLRTIWSYTIISASGSGSTQYDGTIRIRLMARTLTASSLEFQLEIVDNSDPAYRNDSEGGSPTITISCVTGRADPAILSSPQVPHPVVSVLPATSW